MRFLPFILASMLLLAAPGCSLFGKKKEEKQVESAPKAEPVRPDPEFVGIVTLVNEADRFVLVDIDQGAVPAQGTALKVFGDGTQTAVLAVGDVRRRPFIVGDIVNGTPARGQKVFK